MSELRTYRGQNIREQRIEMSGNAYFDCTFQKCEIVIDGQSATTIERCRFMKCEFVFTDAAATAMQWVRVIWASADWSYRWKLIRFLTRDADPD